MLDETAKWVLSVFIFVMPLLGVCKTQIHDSVLS